MNQPFANYMSHKVKKALVLVMIWVARHLGDEPVLAVGLAASHETSSAQFHNSNCSANGSVPVVSRWACCESALFIFAKVSQLPPVNELGKDDDTEKVQVLFMLMHEEISRQDDLMRSCKLDRIALLRMFKAG